MTRFVPPPLRLSFKATDLDVDAEYDHDGGIEMYESKQKRGGDREQQQKRERDRQVWMADCFGLKSRTLVGVPSPCDSGIVHTNTCVPPFSGCRLCKECQAGGPVHLLPGQ